MSKGHLQQPVWNNAMGIKPELPDLHPILLTIRPPTNPHTARAVCAALV